MTDEIEKEQEGMFPFLYAIEERKDCSDVNLTVFEAGSSTTVALSQSMLKQMIERLTRCVQ